MVQVMQPDEERDKRKEDETKILILPGKLMVSFSDRKKKSIHSLVRVKESHRSLKTNRTKMKIPAHCMLS